MLAVDVPVIFVLSLIIANGLIPAYPIGPIVIAMLFGFNFLLVWRYKQSI